MSDTPPTANVFTLADVRPAPDIGDPSRTATIVSHQRGNPSARDPEIVRQLNELDVPFRKGPGSHDGYLFDLATHMYMLIDDGAIVGKLEFSRGFAQIDDASTYVIHWLVAPGHGSKMLRAFEQRISAGSPTAFRLSFLVEPRREARAQKRINFYAKHGYRVIFSHLNADGYEMIWWKGVGKSVDYELANAHFDALHLFGDN